MTNETTISALSAHVQDAEGGLAGRVTYAVARAIAACAIAAGVVTGLAGVLALDVSVPVVAASALAGALVVAAGGLHPKGPLIACAVVFAAAVLAVLLDGGGAGALEGARALWTCFASRLADASDWRIPELALADETLRDASAAQFLLLVTPWIGALIAALMSARTAFWILALLPFWLFVCGIDGWKLPAGAVGAVISGSALAIGLATPREHGALARTKVGMGRTINAACALALAAIALGALSFAAPANIWRQPPDLQLARSTAGGAVHIARYGSGCNALTDGSFQNLGAWRADDTVALELVCQNPEPAYLRGFVGARRDSSGWQQLDESDYHDADGLFWWLHADGFNPTNQLSAALAASLENDEAARQLKASKKRLVGVPQKVTITNRAASSEWLYLPYGIVLPSGSPASTYSESRTQASVTSSSLIESAPPLKDHADEAAAPRGLFGLRDYAFTAQWGLDVAYPDIAALSWIAHDDGGVYWKSESNYNAFVYDNYTENSDVDEAMVSAVIGEAGVSQGSHIDYSAAAQKVVAWLNKNATYDEGYVRAGGTDVLGDFLGGEKRGWSAQYATAAVVMLRHYGIPARYVEGYVVTPDNVKAAQNGTNAVNASGTVTVEIPAANGHAWAEMYVDGAGWVPIETVPKMRGTMPQPDWSSGIQANGTSRNETPPDELTQLQPQEQSSVAEFLRKALESLGFAILTIIIAFDVFALVFFIVALVRRLVAKHRRNLAFSDPDDAAATRSMAAWMAELARYRFPQIAPGDARGLAAAVESAYGAQVASDWKRAQACGRKAAFSGMGVSREERNDVADVAEAFAEEVRQVEGYHARWIMKYIERLL